MSVQTIADTIILIDREHKQNMTLKADINYMSSLLYKKSLINQKWKIFSLKV